MLFPLIALIKEDNNLFGSKTEEQKAFEQKQMEAQKQIDELNTIKMPKLDE